MLKNYCYNTKKLLFCFESGFLEQLEEEVYQIIEEANPGQVDINLVYPKLKELSEIEDKDEEKYIELTYKVYKQMIKGMDIVSNDVMKFFYENEEKTSSIRNKEQIEAYKKENKGRGLPKKKRLGQIN